MTSRIPSVIRGLSVISAVGRSASDWKAAIAAPAAPCKRFSQTDLRPVFPLSLSVEASLAAAELEVDFDGLDRVTLSAVAAARGTFKCLRSSDRIGCISIGSSRGPTTSLEHTLREFDREHGRVPVATSPVTTAGNISSWVAQDYLSQRNLPDAPIASLSTSMTCSSAFHSLLIARSFLLSEMAGVCLFGGAEACLTPYTISQMDVLKIYAREATSWPCQPFGVARGSASSVALGEGAGTALLMPGDTEPAADDLLLLGVGWAVEPIPSATGVSADGNAFKAAMSMALAEMQRYGFSGVDCVVAHAPGTQKGDAAELAAIYSVFGSNLDILSTKHLTGHTYGASGMVSLQLAFSLLTEQAEWLGFPYLSCIKQPSRRPPKTIAINTAGFGGNSISIIVANRPNKAVHP